MPSRIDQTTPTLDSASATIDASLATGTPQPGLRIDQTTPTLDSAATTIDALGTTSSQPTVRADATSPTVDSTGLTADAGGSSGTVAANVQQSLNLSLPTQAAAAGALAKAQQGAVTVPGVTFDSGTVTLDGGVTLDNGSTLGGTVLRLPAQTAHVQALPPGAFASQLLLAPARTATAVVLVAAQQASLLALPAPSQAASVEAPNPSASELVANQFLPAPARTAAATVRVVAQSSRALAPPAQVAAIETGLRDRLLSASQLLPAPLQTARVVPFVAPVEPGPRPPDTPVEEPEVVAVTGDLEDMIARQAAVLPPWFGAPGTVPAMLRLPLAMAASAGSWIYDLIEYAKLQTRIRTATDGWLDLIAWDFFGNRIKRRAGQGDESFRRRIIVEMFRPRATRPAMASVLTDLTGYAPRIFEPSRPQDVGGIGVGGGMGIGVSGAIGSIGLPGEVFITAYRDPDFGVPFAAGIGVPVGGVGVASRLVVSSLDEITGALRDEDVFAAVEATRPVGIRTWVRIALGERR